MIAEFEHVDRVRRLVRDGGRKMIDAGVAPVDAALGTAYAAFDLVESFAGEGLGAVEWLRTFADVLERSIIAGTARKPE